MAVVNKYTDANLALGKLASNSSIFGGQQRCAIATFVVASTDQAGSIYRVFKALPPDIIVKSIRIFNDALTGATAVNVGAYGVQDYDGVGAAISAACFASGINIASGNPVTAAPAIADSALSIANRSVPAFTVFGDSQFPAKHPAWDLALTFTNLTTGATGNVAVILEYTQM